MEWNRVVILSLLLKKYTCLLTATVPCALLVLTHYTANTTYMQRKLRCNTAQWVPLPTQSVDSKRAGNSIGNSIHLGICIIYILYILDSEYGELTYLWLYFRARFANEWMAKIIGMHWNAQASLFIYLKHGVFCTARARFGFEHTISLLFSILSFSVVVLHSIRFNFMWINTHFLY